MNSLDVVLNPFGTPAVRLEPQPDNLIRLLQRRRDPRNLPDAISLAHHMNVVAKVGLYQLAPNFVYAVHGEFTEGLQCFLFGGGKRDNRLGHRLFL